MPRGTVSVRVRAATLQEANHQTAPASVSTRDARRLDLRVDSRLDVRAKIKHRQCMNLQLPFSALRLQRLDGTVIEKTDERSVAALVRPDEMLLVVVRPFMLPSRQSSSTATTQKDTISTARFRVDGEQLGEGSFSQVYRGTDIQTGEPVAIKVVDAAMLDTAAARRYHEREKRIVQDVRHPNIVTTLAVLETKRSELDGVLGTVDAASAPNAMHDVYHWFVMEYCPGGALSSVSTGRRFSEVQVRKCISQIADAFHYLHRQKIVHRDLKPQNILLTSRDLSTADFKLCDFGFARTHNIEADPHGAGLQGIDALMQSYPATPLYAAPELMLQQPYDSKCDLWSLGAIMYELLAGRILFHGITALNALKQEHRTAERHGTASIAKRAELPGDVHVSEQCRDLMARLLVRDRVKRISWEQLFAHPFVYGISTRRVHLVGARGADGSSTTASFEVAVKAEHTISELRTALQAQTKIPPSAQLLIADQGGREEDGNYGGLELPSDGTVAVWEANAALFVFDTRVSGALQGTVPAGVVPDASAFMVDDPDPVVRLSSQLQAAVDEMMQESSDSVARLTSSGTPLVRLQSLRDKFVRLHDVFESLQQAAVENLAHEEGSVLPHAKVHVRGFGVALACLRRLSRDLHRPDLPNNSLQAVEDILQGNTRLIERVLEEMPRVLNTLDATPVDASLSGASTATLGEYADSTALRHDLEQLKEVYDALMDFCGRATSLLGDVPEPSALLRDRVADASAQLQGARTTHLALLAAYAEDTAQARHRCDTEIREANRGQASATDQSVVCDALAERYVHSCSCLRAAVEHASSIAAGLESAWKLNRLSAAYTQRHVSLLQMLRRVCAELPRNMALAQDLPHLLAPLASFLWPTAADREALAGSPPAFSKRYQEFLNEMARRRRSVARVGEFSKAMMGTIQGWAVVERERWSKFAAENTVQQFVGSSALGRRQPVLDPARFPGVADAADAVPSPDAILASRPHEGCAAVLERLPRVGNTSAEGFGDGDGVHTLAAQAVQLLLSESMDLAKVDGTGKMDNILADLQASLVADRGRSGSALTPPPTGVASKSHKSSSSVPDGSEVNAEIQALRDELARARSSIARRDDLIAQFEAQRLELDTQLSQSRAALLRAPPASDNISSAAAARADAADSRARLESIDETLRRDHNLAICPMCSTICPTTRLEAHVAESHL